MKSLDPIKEKIANSCLHGHTTLDTVSFLSPLPSYSVFPCQENLPVYKRGLGDPVTTQSALSLSQVPVFHLDSLQIVWLGLRNQKPGKGACDGCNHPRCLTCYHHHLTHSAGNPAPCRRNSKGHFAASWVTSIFFPLANTKVWTDIYFFSPQVNCKWHSISLPQPHLQPTIPLTCGSPLTF